MPSVEEHRMNLLLPLIYMNIQSHGKSILSVKGSAIDQIQESGIKIPAEIAMRYYQGFELYLQAFGLRGSEIVFL